MSAVRLRNNRLCRWEWWILSDGICRRFGWLDYTPNPGAVPYFEKIHDLTPVRSLKP